MSKATETNKFAHLLHKKVTFDLPNAPQVPGTISRTSDSSIWVTFQLPTGSEVTHRFYRATTSAAPNAFRKLGTGPFAPKLRFV